jgi:hypothetical protein
VLAEVAKRKPIAFAFETQPELCTSEVFGEIHSMLPGTTWIAVQLGVDYRDEPHRQARNPS